ncbi:hypothetical protein EON65_52140 [archaeon]|nr:MAG: hypothetical protein EON65_52140 [archaeon]
MLWIDPEDPKEAPDDAFAMPRTDLNEPKEPRPEKWKMARWPKQTYYKKINLDALPAPATWHRCQTGAECQLPTTLHISFADIVSTQRHVFSCEGLAWPWWVF